MESSLIYSMGTALNRAREHEAGVDVLVSGQWLSGRVVAVDGHGVLLETDTLEHAVVKMDSVQAVRVHAPAPNSGADVGSEYGSEYAHEYGSEHGHEYGSEYGHEYGQEYGSEYAPVPAQIRRL